MSKKRNIKFLSSGGVPICQWCINDLTNEHYTFEEAKDQVKKLAAKICDKPDCPIEPISIDEHDLELSTNRAVNRLLGDRPEPPRLTFNSYAARCKAIEKIKSQENAIETVFKSIFCSKNRENAIQEIVETEKQNCINSHQQDIATYEKESADYEHKFKLLQSNRINDAIRNNENEFIKYKTEHKKYLYLLEEKKKEAYINIISTNEYNKNIRPIFIKHLRAYHLRMISSNKVSREVATLYDIPKGSVCFLCKKKEFENHFHHIIPIDKYGTNEPNNIVFLCYSCHNKQHKGFTVTRNKRRVTQRTGSEFVAVDIETTGLGYSKEKIIAIAALHVKDLKIISKFSTLINPYRSIPYKISKLTGISNEMLSQAPVLDDVVDDFYEFISEHKLVLHNSTFDINFINYHTSYFGYKIDNEIIDTLKISRKYMPELNNHKLKTLISLFNISDKQSHRAMDDCIATSLVYINLLRSRQKNHCEYVTKLIT